MFRNKRLPSVDHLDRKDYLPLGRLSA